MQDRLKSARRMPTWQFPEDTPAGYTNKLDCGKQPGDFLGLGGKAVIRERYEAYEYAAVEYERSGRRRLTCWSDATLRSARTDRPTQRFWSSPDPERLEWEWHGAAVLCREDFAECGSQAWTRDSVACLPRRDDITRLELLAIDLAFGLASQKLRRDLETHGHRRGWGTFVDFTDSQSAIMAIRDFRLGEPYQSMVRSWEPVITAINAKFTFLRSHGVAVELHWVPSHVGIEGNELADEEADAAAEFGKLWDATGDPSKASLQWNKRRTQAWACLI